MVSSHGVLVNNKTTPNEIYFSSSGNGGKSFIISAKEHVSLMVHLFLQRGLKYLEMTLAALYVIIPVWSIIGQNFKSLIFMLSTDKRFFCFSRSIYSGWLVRYGNISSDFSYPLKLHLRNCLRFLRSLMVLSSVNMFLCQCLL